jgi:methylenetetrahydrofolate dehydrogenase (NADP+) / methenyltetrahydrofolate cyclohydrolase
MQTQMMSAAPIASELKQSISKSVEEIRSKYGVVPKLVAVLIGDDPVSRTYVELKSKDCAEVGINSEVVDLSTTGSNESSEGILETIRILNEDPAVNAILPQMPFNGRVREESLFSLLDPNKDVDGLSPFRLGKLIRGEYDLNLGILPCTPKGVILLCKYYGVPIEGADVAIVGRGILVGEPLRKLFQDLNATAYCCHTRTRGLDQKLKEADIVVAASGRPPELYGEAGFRVINQTVKDGSTVISVGTKKDPSTGKMLFDVDTSSLKGKCSFLTPNTGGVGVMTRVSLLQNTVNATRIQNEMKNSR